MLSARRVITAIIVLLSLAACISNPDQQQEIRIVDLQGRPARKIITRTPELNSQILAQQGNQLESNYRIASAAPTSPIDRVPPSSQETANTPYKFGNNPNNSAQSFGSASSQAINETLQVPTYQAPAQKVTRVFKKVEPQQEPDSDSKSNADSITVAGVNDQDKDQIIEYDLNAEEDSDAVVTSAKNSASSAKKKIKIIDTSKTKSAAPKSDKKSSANGKFFIQVGSFTEAANADKLLAKMKKFHAGSIKTVEGSNGIKHRVILGPFAKESDAKKLIGKLKSSGQEAILTK